MLDYEPLFYINRVYESVFFYHWMFYPIQGPGTEESLDALSTSHLGDRRPYTARTSELRLLGFYLYSKPLTSMSQIALDYNSANFRNCSADRIMNCQRVRLTLPCRISLHHFWPFCPWTLSLSVISPKLQVECPDYQDPILSVDFIPFILRFSTSQQQEPPPLDKPLPQICHASNPFPPHHPPPTTPKNHQN